MKNLYSLISILIFAIFAGCGDSRDSINAKDSKAQGEKYKEDMESEFAFLDSTNIINNDDNKITMLIFGSDGCGSCERLKEIIFTNKNIQKAINDDFLPYYINLSDNKNHKIAVNDDFQSISTAELKQLFKIVGTPTLVFIKNKKIILNYPGFIGEQRLMLTLKALKDSKLNEQDLHNITKEILSIYQQQGV